MTNRNEGCKAGRKTQPLDVVPALPSPLSFHECGDSNREIRELWKIVGRLCRWKHQMAPGMVFLFGDKRVTKALLSFIQETEAEQVATVAPRGNEGEEVVGS